MHCKIIFYVLGVQDLSVKKKTKTKTKQKQTNKQMRVSYESDWISSNFSLPEVLI